MKKLTLVLFVLAALSASMEAYAARQNPTVTGRVVDDTGAAVEYATVVLLSADMEQVTGATSDVAGHFSLSAAAGKYIIKVFYLGFEDAVREVDLSGSIALGDIVLASASTEMEVVKVTGRLIVREADRFVVTIADNPVAVGKDAFEMLKTSPGVWVNSGNITINGRSGTKVMVNDRMVRLSGEDLENYLRAIKAEDIQKIEIIPQSGADYDADSSGGIIKITLARQRNDGVQGNVSLSGGLGKYQDYRIAPSAGINYQAGKLNLYASGGYGASSGETIIKEETVYTDHNPRNFNSQAKMDGTSSRWNTSLGGVYDFDAKNSAGAEFSIFDSSGDIKTIGTSLETNVGGLPKDITSNYVTDRETRYYAGSVNYIRKMDEKGSTFKLIGDYAGSVSSNDNVNVDNMVSGLNSAAILKTDLTDSDFAIYSASASFDIVRSPSTVIKTGAKYNHNSVKSTIDMKQSVDGGTPSRETTQTDYTEHVSALYFIYNTRFGKLGLSAGVRGEYTYIIPKFTTAEGEGGKEKGYFDVFPNANLSYPLNATYSNSLVLSYSRSIQRPHFNYLTPFRNYTSPNSYIAGNPDLKPMYTNDVSLTAILAYKYTITAGVSFMKNQTMQKVLRETENGQEVLVYRFENIPTTTNYYVAVNAPVTIKEWWTANINLTGLYMSQDMKDAATSDYTPPKHKFVFVANASTNISIPKWFDIELGGYFMSRIMNANMIVEPMGNVNASIKRRFANNKLTASLGVESLFYVRQNVNSIGDGFNKWAYVNNGDYLTVNLSLRYNFNAGVSFRARKVERGAEDDIKRIGGGDSSGSR